VGTEAKATVARHALADHLAERTSVGLAEYESLVVEAERSLTQSAYTPDRAGSPTHAEHWDKWYRGRGRLVLDGVRDYYRAYSWS
jgi:hypothetical protein